jgi:molybdopterin/thiamine biosynthesis adenylyltransferase/rhodanese-related sulfurtransferase
VAGSRITPLDHAGAPSLAPVSEPVEIEPQDVDLAAFAVVLDVRPTGVTPGFPTAIRATIPQVLSDPASLVPSPTADVLVVCDIGLRSRTVVEGLHTAGYRNARSLAGGVDAWRRAGRHLLASDLPPSDAERYDRQLRLSDIGVDGQRAIGSATVTVVGAGGLGLPVIAYLAGAGVGTLRIVDDDIVELSNLHRQPLFGMDDIGRPKSEVAARYVTAVNPTISADPVIERLTSVRAMSLLEGSDVIVDATDRFEARYAINDAAHAMGIPVVSGAVYRWEGQLTVLAPDGPCYRCIFPNGPGAVDLDCAVTGVAGPVVGTVGALQATEVIKLLTGAGRPLTGTLVIIDGLTGSSMSVRVARRPDCPTCGDQIANAGSPSG